MTTNTNYSKGMEPEMIFYRGIRKFLKKTKEWNKRNRKKIYLFNIIASFLTSLVALYAIVQCQFMVEVYTNVWDNIGFRGGSGMSTEVCYESGCKFLTGDEISSLWHKNLYGSIVYIALLGISTFVGGIYIGRLWDTL